MTGYIQSDNAVLMLFKDDWVPFVCTTDLSISLSADVLPIRTPGGGHWAKNAYQKLNYTISISSVLIYDQPTDTMFTGMDMLDNVLGFVNAKFRISYTDDQGNTKSVQGSGVINGVTWSASTGAVVKGDISIVGDGELKFFDGYIPCDSTITSIGITGQTGASGIVTITYAYTGAPYQVKYRLNGTGPYSYALLGVSIVTTALDPGNYSIELIPVCSNGYEADNSASQAFVVTRALTCSAVTTLITTSGGILTPTFTGSPAQWEYSIDGGSFNVVSIFTTSVNISTLSVGTHTVTVNPICSNGVRGTGIANQLFTVTLSPTNSLIQYSLFSITATDNVLQVWVNGILNASISGSGTHSGSFTCPIGASVTGTLVINNDSGQNGTLTTTDNTTSTTLNIQSHVVPGVLTYSFTANGDTFSIGGSIL